MVGNGKRGHVSGVSDPFLQRHSDDSGEAPNDENFERTEPEEM
jgi:hypothetical protein